MLLTPRRGRPPLDPDDPSVPISLYLPSKLFARICAKARLDRITPSEKIRRELERAFSIFK